jgi:hypothetical protein
MRHPSKNQQSKDNDHKFTIIVVTASSVIIMWLVFGVANAIIWSKQVKSEEGKYEISYVDAGTFGDSFGLVNSLFSGLAFGGVIIAIYFQTQELKLQRKELILQRKDLQRGIAAQEEIVKLQALNTLYEFYDKQSKSENKYIHKHAFNIEIENVNGDVTKTLLYRRLQTLVDMDNVYYRSSKGKDSPVKPIKFEVEGLKKWHWRNNFLQAYRRHITGDAQPDETLSHRLTKLETIAHCLGEFEEEANQLLQKSILVVEEFRTANGDDNPHHVAFTESMHKLKEMSDRLGIPEEYDIYCL